MKTPAVTAAIYKKLVKFATLKGSVSMIGTVIGSLDEKTIQAYLNHMKATDPALYKSWGSKHTPVEEEEDDDPTANLEDDDDDPTAGLEDEPEPPPRQKTEVKQTGKKEQTAGLDDLFSGREEFTSKDVKQEPPAAPAGIPAGHMLIDGKIYPQQFRFRDANGLDTDLEVFSKHPKWGLIVRFPVPSDIRKVMLAGGEVEVDMLALKRDPNGTTVINGKKYSNSKLAAAAELQEN